MSDNTRPENIELQPGESHELLAKPEDLLELVPPPPEGLLVASPEERILQSINSETSGIIISTPDILPFSTTMQESVETVSHNTLSPTESFESISSSPNEAISPREGESEAEMLDDSHLFDTVASSAPEQRDDISIPSEAVVASTVPDVVLSSTPVSVVPSQDVTGAVPLSVNEASTIVTENTPTETMLPQVDIPVPPTLSSIPSIPFEPANPITPTVSPSSHKNMIIVGIIAVLVLFGVIAWFIFGSSKETDDESMVKYTISPETESPSTYEKAREQALNTQEKDIEIFNTAMKQGDTTLCKSVSDTKMQLECTENLSLIELSASGTLAQCDEFTLVDTRSRCKTTMTQKEAEKTMNKTLCSSIEDADQAQYCREQIDEIVVANLIESKTATEPGCRQLEKKFQEACLASIARIDDKSILDSALSTDNLEKCQSLSTENLQVACFDSVLLKRALANGDRSVCELIRDQAKQDACLGKANAMSDNDTFKKAIVDKNINLCGTISTKTLADKCYDSVTMLVVRDTHNVSLCDGLKNPTSLLENCRKLGGAQ